MARLLGWFGLALMSGSSLWLFIAMSAASASIKSEDLSASELNAARPGLAARMAEREASTIKSAALATQLWPALFVAGAVFVAAGAVSRDTKIVTRKT